MYELLYTSVATRQIDDGDLRSIGLAAQSRNAACDVTGALMYENRTFMQLLEGDQKEVQALLALISNDPRHTSINVFSEGPIQERSFPQWSMAVGKASPPWLDLPADGERLKARNEALDLFCIMCKDLIAP